MERINYRIASLVYIIVNLFVLDCDNSLSDSNNDGDREIYTMNAEGTNLLRLTDNAKNDQDPARSKNGTKIVYDNDYKIYIIKSDGSPVKTITPSVGVIQVVWTE